MFVRMWFNYAKVHILHNFFFLLFEKSQVNDIKITGVWILFADKRFSTNNNLQTTTVSSSPSPVSEKRAAITASKKSSSATKHVNQTSTPVANKTSHAKGERSLSISFFLFFHLQLSSVCGAIACCQEDVLQTRWRKKKRSEAIFEFISLEQWCSWLQKGAYVKIWVIFFLERKSLEWPYSIENAKPLFGLDDSNCQLPLCHRRSN